MSVGTLFSHDISVILVVVMEGGTVGVIVIICIVV
jgi:hypothetical protein